LNTIEKGMDRLAKFIRLQIEWLVSSRLTNDNCLGGFVDINSWCVSFDDSIGTLTSDQ
jgi:hypothetical protein